MNRLANAKKRPVFLAAPVRTPMGKFGGCLASLTAVDLGVVASKEVIHRSGVDPESIGEAIFGNARPAGARPNPARHIAFKAALPHSVPGYTINMACASGMRSITNACQSILLGENDVILAGGTESMSNAPYLLMKARWGYRLGHDRLVDSMYQDGYLCPLCDQVMGETAENLAYKYRIGREKQDAYAATSQQRCEAARKAGRFQDEVVPVEVTDSKGRTTRVECDVLAVSEKMASDLNGSPMVRVVDFTVSGVDPAFMGIGPVPAVRRLLQRNRLSIEDIHLIELNEAFAVQVLACDKELHFDMDRLNVNGGAIALGHPSGCTGTRIVVTLMHEMHRRGAKLGMATLCVSGGLGMALLVERV